MIVKHNELNRTLQHRKQRALYAGASHIKNQLTKNLMQGTRSGRRYKIPGTDVYYTASKPGEYPAYRTGALARSYRIEPVLPGAITDRVTIGTPLHYAPILERKRNRKHLERTYRENADETKRIMKRVFASGRDI